MSFFRFSSTLALLLLVASGCANSKSPVDTAEADRAALQDATSVVGKIDPEERQRKALQAHLQAGMTALKMQDPERARRHISRALEISPSSAEANNAMALLYDYEHDEVREEKYFKRAVRGDGNVSQARNNYAAYLYRKQRYKDAAKQLEKAVDDEFYDQRSVAFFNLGRCYAQLKHLDKAEAAFQRSLRLDSQRVDTMLELADVLLQQQRYADAASYLSMYQDRTRNTARSLWVGIRLASRRGEADKLASYEFQLEKMYKDSPEYVEWRAWKSGGGTPTGKRK